MSQLQQPKKRRYLSALSSVFQSRPSSLNNAVQVQMSAVSSSLAGPSRILDDSHIVDESVHRVVNTPNPQRPSAMFSGIGQVHIGVGHFNQNIYNVSNRDDSILNHVAFQSLPRSCDAAFSAAIDLDNLTRRPCTDGTRVDIIAEIMTWVNETNPTRAPPVYWLTGLAGLGAERVSD